MAGRALVPRVTDRKGAEIPLDLAPDVCRYLRGCLWAEVLKDGMVYPRRFSEKQMGILKGRGRAHRARATAGECLAFVTDGTQVRLDVRVLLTLEKSHDGALARELVEAQGAEGERRAAESGVMDSITLEVEGVQHVATVESGTLAFDLHNPERRPLTCRIWLPYLMAVAVGNLCTDGSLEPAPERPLLLTLGDSITQGLVVGSPAKTWPVRLARSLDCSLLNQGVAGHIFDARTLKGMGAVKDAGPSLVVVAYGTNDWSRVESDKRIANNAKAYLRAVKRFFPTARIYVVSPLWRADEAQASASGRPLAWVAALLRDLCLKIGLEFVDGFSLVGHDPANFGDLRLHPNAAGAAQMAEGLCERIRGDEAAARAREMAATAGLSAAAVAADEQSLAREGVPGAHPAFSALVRTIWRLRQPDGCPWDKEQTHASIKRNMVEEAYEAVDAIEAGDVAHLREELGDVLMQVLLHAQIAADAGAFSIDDVVAELDEKLVRRHPHVFGDAAAENPDEVLDIWESVKGRERAKTADGLLDSVPRSLPALMECQKISKRAARCGFDWDDVDGVWRKFAEERAEFEAEEPGSPEAELEFGDVLFSLVNVARKQGIDAEAALRASNAKFRRRWAAMEALGEERGVALDGLSHDDLEELWSLVKEPRDVNKTKM